MKIEWTSHNDKEMRKELAIIPFEFVIGIGFVKFDKSFRIDIHLFLGFISIEFGEKNE